MSQQQQLDPVITESSLTYWQQKLGSAPEFLSLPTDRPRPAVQSGQRENQNFLLSPQLTEAIRLFSQQKEVSLFTTLLAAYDILLYRYTGTEDILVGSVIANGHEGKSTDLTNINSLVFRTDISGNPSVQELLDRVQKIVLEAYTHGNLPFNVLLDKLKIQQELSYSPLFQVMLVFDEENIFPENIKDQKTKCDLILFLKPTSEGLASKWEYNTDLFDSSTIERMSGHFQTLLEGIVANPEKPISEFNLLTAPERQQLIWDWNNTQVAYPQNKCIHQLVEEQVERTPDAVAVVFADKKLTYRELNNRANQLANYLQSLGVKPESLVGISVERSLEMIIGLLAIQKAGGAYVPIDPTYPIDRIAYMLEDSQVPVLLTQNHLTATLPEYQGKIICLDTDWGIIETQSVENPVSGVTDKNLIYIIYTSGSTGKPKGTMNIHEGVVNRILWMQDAYQLKTSDRILQKTPFSFDVSGWEFWWPLLTGACLVFAKPEGHKDSNYLVELINSQQITTLHFVPSMLQIFLLDPQVETCRSLRLVFCSGEALPVDLQEKFFNHLNAELHNLYGPTEAAIDVTFWQCQPGSKLSTVPIGRPVANTQTYILDSHLQPVPIGVPGELYLGGIQLARGYLNRPELTAEKFIENPFLEDFQSPYLYKTGDLARYFPDGNIEYLGRLDNQVKIRGNRIELGEIESALNQYPEVQESVVIAREDSPGDKRIVAYVVIDANAQDSHTQSPETPSEPEENQAIEQWQQIFDSVYNQVTPEQDKTSNITSWDSSYTGQAIPTEEMQEWVDTTVERIKENKPQRVLEIGCGTGLLLFRIAAECSYYCGTDISKQGLDYIHNQLSQLPGNWSQVNLKHKPAHNFEGLEIASLDAVIINSVVQYFPNINYLLEVLAGAMKIVTPGGFIFVGDVRSLPLLETFHTSVQFYQAPDELPLTQLQQKIQKNIRFDKELVISPAFFTALQQHFPEISEVKIQLRRGYAQNEMTKFRYDVILKIGTVPAKINCQQLNWQENQLTVSDIYQQLQTTQPETFVINNIPNSRVCQDIKLLKLLNSSSELNTVGDLRSSWQEMKSELGIEPEDWWGLSESLPYAIDVNWSGDNLDLYDVTFYKKQKEIIISEPLSQEISIASNQNWYSYANNPAFGQIAANLGQQLRSFLNNKLPDYMVPSAFVFLEALPLSPNGKVDRRALPIPDIGRSQLETAYVKPQNETEQIITKVWQEILQIDKIGINDNFFDLGGHSLLMAQVSRELSKVLGQKLSIVELFQYPTIQTLSTYLFNQSQGQKQKSKYKSKRKQQEQTSIAIIGMAGRFPGAENINEFWQNLRDGVESITPLSDEELQATGIESHLLNDPNYVKSASILPNIAGFDASFFGYSAREAQVTDPQQRLFLECAWSALENAGYQPDSDEYSIGVYGGAGQNTYLFSNISQNSEFAPGRFVDTGTGIQVLIGNGGDFLTTRVAYKLNLTGPAINIQTACSTSLVAIHTACQSLLKGECDIALAGGVSVLVPQKVGYLYQEGLMLSPDGHCRTFDAQAQGTTFGDGVGIVVLKPLEQAIADGDYIHVVIKGTAINNDGNLKVSYTAPSVDGQAAVIIEAQKEAGIDPQTITYIEAHGTATPLGDPIEITALTQAFRTKTDKTGYCAIGSVKSNFGHLITAAGIAGLIKTALALKHQQIPPSLNFEQPNPEIDFEKSPFYVNTKLSAWESNGFPRRAGVSSFGFGGTNAHVVLEEWDDTNNKSKAHPQKSKELLVISAKTASALDTATINLATHLKENPEINLADVAYTLSIGRVGFNHRRIVAVSDIEDAANTLNTVDKKRVLTNSGKVKPHSVVFMFSGQGSQYVNMARELYETETYFQEKIDLCCEILQPYIGFDLRDVLYPSAEETEAATAKLTQTATTQPALFVIEYAIAQLWMKWGITPVAMIGHSIGEYVAATLAGVFSLEDALGLVAARGKLMESMPPGSMLAVPLPENEVQPLLAGTSLQIAVINSPSNCVVSGTTTAIEAFAKQLEEQDIEGRLLHTSHAFHSQMMAEILEPFTEKVKQIRLNPPTIPFVSNVTGTWITVEDATNPSYYAQHLRQAVRFADGVKQFFDHPEQILLEVGPGRTLSTLAKRHPDKLSEQITLTSIRHPQDEYSDVSFLLNNLGQMWLAGLEVNWSAFYGERENYRVPLPTYPFERKHYWIEPSKPTTETKLDEGKKPDIADWFYVPTWKQSFNIPTAKIQSPILVFVDECGLGSQLVTELESQKLEVVKVVTGEKFNQLENNLYSINPSQSSDYDSLLQELDQHKINPKTILHLWNVTVNQEIKLTVDIAEKQQSISFYSLLYLTQSLGKKNVLDEMKILVISNHLQNVNDEEILNPAKATLMGPVLVISQENYQVECRSIDIILSETGSQREKKIIGQLLQEIQIKSTDKAIAYRGNHRWVQTFEPVRLEPPTSETPRLRMAGVYLITGGLGGIGLVIANHLAKTVQAKLVLTGRTVLPERENWDKWLAEHDAEDSTSEKIRKAQELEALGAEVLVVKADVANLPQMEKAIATAQNHFGQINGVIHAAGVVDQQAFPSIQETSKAIVNQHFLPKVNGTLVLSQLLSQSSVDFCLVMSSISTVLGGLGYVGYAAACHFLNAWTHQENQNSSTTWISINWDLWKVGKFEQSGSLVNLAILPEEGMNAMNCIFSVNVDIAEQVIVSTGALHPRIDKWVKLLSLQDNNSESLDTEPSETNTIGSTQLEQTIINIWQQVLGVDNIRLDDNFFELGGDSLVAVQLLSKLRKNIDSQVLSSLELSLRQLFKTPTIGELLASIEKSGEQVSDVSQSLTIIPRANKDSAPLSFAQQRVWFLEQLEPNRADYHINQASYLTGSLDINILQKSLDAIVARNEVLRTNFITDTQSNPIQIIGQPRQVELPIFDLPDCPKAEQETAVQNWIKQEQECSFNLSTDLMIRAKLLRITPQNHVLLLITHHIASDGSSEGLLWKQLSTVYEAFINNQPNTLPEMPIQYADFALWQRQWLSGGELDKQLQYWKQQLAGINPILEIPTDYPRPLIQTYTESGRQSLRLSPTLSKSIQALGRQQEVTLFMTMLAAFQILLYRYSGQEDIIVGSPSAGRNQPEIEELIGFFINTLVLRGDLSGNPSFKELLAQVRETALGAYGNQYTPFEKLVQELEIKRDLSRNPLFQVWFNMMNFQEEKIELPGLIAEPIFIPESSKFDFSLYVKEQEQGIDLELIYKPNLFAPERMREMLEQFEALLTQIVAEPEKSIHSYSLVTANSQALLPNPSQVIPQPEYPPITNIFTDWATRTPQQAAIIQNERIWSYQELAQVSTEIAQVLITANIQKGDVVAVSGIRSFGLIASMLGVLMSGGVLLNIDPNLPTTRQELMLSTAIAKTVLFISKEAKNTFADSLKTITINPDTGKASLTSSSTTPVTVTLSPEDSAYIFFTSGTTGTPKGVLGCHQGLSHFLNWQRSTFAITPQDRVAQLTGLSFDVVLRDIFLPLISGAALCLPGVDDNLSPMRVLPWLENQQISLMHTVPTLIQSWLMDVPRGISLRSLRLLFSAGEPLTDTLIKQWRSAFPESGQIINLYGPTETTLAKCYYPVPSNPLPGVQPVGSPLPETQALIFTPNSQLCGIGEAGEIVFRTPFRTKGYINADPGQLSKFAKNPFRDDDTDLLYYTGDRGRYRLDGTLEILGRIDQQIKIRGVRIEPGEISATINQNPLIKASVVIAREDIPGNKCLVAYVVPNSPDLNISELRQFLKQRLPDYMIPSAFVTLEALPVTANGKIDKRALPAPTLDQQQSTQTFVAPRNDIEKQLIAIWEKILGVQTISVTDNFFELGGHSLLALRLLSEIETGLGKSLTLATLFVAQTVEQLAISLGSEEKSRTCSSLVPIKTAGTKPPLFLIHAIWGNILFYRELVSYLPPDQPVYGLEAKGLDGKAAPITSVPEIAAYYIEAMRTVQPHGPYFIGGHSFGAIVAFEIAQQLHNQGEKIGTLAILDMDAPAVPESNSSASNSKLSNLQHFLNLGIADQFNYVLPRLQWHLTVGKVSIFYKLYLRYITRSLASLRVLNVAEANKQAQKSYIPSSVYPGTVTLFRTFDDQSEDFEQDKEWGWNQLAHKVEIHEVPGTHNTVMQAPNVKVMSEKLTLCLKEKQTQ